MNKKYLFSFTLILVLLSYIFNVDKIVSNKLLALNTSIKENYIFATIFIDNLILKHFNQVQQIEQLKQQLLDTQTNKILHLVKENKKYDINNSLAIANVVSYLDFNNFSEILLKSKLKIKNISALITPNGYSAGIAINKNNQAVGYLNHHPKSNYAVFIGKNKVPGITHGNKNEKYITIKFIPLWQQININDEVITSGMDNIFPKGIKVGRVIKIKKLSTTAEAFVEPYANVYNKNYFYIYSKIHKF